MNKIEKIFENALWSSRWIVIIAVFSSLALSLFLFYLATSEVIGIINYYLTTMNQNYSYAEKNVLKAGIIANIIKVIDIYLLGIFMLIFSLGIYELFISKIDPAESSELGNRVLLIKSFDDLKLRLGNVIILILTVKFFQQAMETDFSGPLNQLYFALGIVLIAVALYFSFSKSKH